MTVTRSELVQRLLQVAVLLAVTIAYCLVVNRKLEQLRSDQSDIRVVIRDLSAATGQDSIPNAWAVRLRISDSVTRFCGVPVPCACTRPPLRNKLSPTMARAAAVALAMVM